MKKKTVSKNYLEKVPIRSASLRWTANDTGMVTLEIDNVGFFHRIAQRFFKKPAVSYVHLDEMGSFLWPLLDGEKNLIQLGEMVKQRFGESAEPLYERLVKYAQILESYGFIQWNR